MQHGAKQYERGSVSFLIVGVFTVLLLFVGMAVDFGILLRYRRAMQNACDAGVLAGALNLRKDPATAAPTAQRYATNDLVQNNIAWDQLTATTYDPNWQPTLIAPDRIRVLIQKAVPTYFFRLLLPTVPVGTTCTARLTPIILASGLVPLGLNYNTWATYYNSSCWAYVTAGVPISARPAPCQTFPITVDVSAQTNPWGSGNTGLLNMGCFGCSGGGAAAWLSNFINGSSTPYCYDVNHTPAVGDFSLNGASCAIVNTKPGVTLGAIQQGVAARCASTNWLSQIIMMPVLNPAFIGTQGNFTTEIWGFVAFQLDCSNPIIPGQNTIINGGFVSFVSMQATGTPTTFDTGVYTPKLIE